MLRNASRRKLSLDRIYPGTGAYQAAQGFRTGSLTPLALRGEVVSRENLARHWGCTRLHKASAQGLSTHRLSQGRLFLAAPGFPLAVAVPGSFWSLLPPPSSAPGSSRLAPGGFWSLLAGPGCSWGALWEISLLYRKIATGIITNTIIIEEIKKSFFLLNALY